MPLAAKMACQRSNSGQVKPRLPEHGHGGRPLLRRHEDAADLEELDDRLALIVGKSLNTAQGDGDCVEALAHLSRTPARAVRSIATMSLGLCCNCILFIFYIIYDTF